MPAQVPLATAREIRTIYPSEWGVPHPVGLSYSHDFNYLFLLDKSNADHSTSEGSTVVAITPLEDPVDTAHLEFVVDDAINTAFDDSRGRLLLLNGERAELAQIEVGDDGILDPATQVRFDVERFGVEHAQGMDVDFAGQHLFILDSRAQQVVRVALNQSGFDTAEISRIDLSHLGVTDLRGIAVHPTNNNLYVVSPTDQQLFKLTLSGQLVTTYDLGDLDLVDPRGLVFAPSTDMTDPPDTMHLFIADSNLSDFQPLNALYLPLLMRPSGGSAISKYVVGLAEAGATDQLFGKILEVELDLQTLATIRVPQDQPTIQAGINAAQDGDLVLVAPATYTEQLTISGKTITLASQFYTTGDQDLIKQTIIDGDGDTVITVDPSVGPDTKIIGFTIQNGDDGISASAKLHILNNRIINNRDGIDYEAGGGIARNNVFENNRDDAIDLDGPTEVTVEDNVIRNNGDDGIEIRLHEYSGPTLNIIIRNNLITGSDEDGIQLVDYPDASDRIFLIERNLIQDSAKAGLGLMDNGESGEDFRAASIPERIHLFNNTFVNNDYGLTGGDNLVALNNIFLGSTNIAIKNVDGNSITAYNLFWNNGTTNQGSNQDEDTTLFADPLLTGDHRLQRGSPAIDAGTAHFEWRGEVVLDLPSSAYAGTAPDLGMFESNFTAISPPVFVGAGDIANCSDDEDEETAKLLDSIAGTVFTLGDNAYPDGTAAQFNNCYDPTWGRHKARTRPTSGNHDYHTPGASGYFSYFGAAAGGPNKGYYSYNLGDWHIIALNSECGEVGGCDSDSPQGQWLQADLAANPSVCTLAYWHKPRFSSGRHGDSSAGADFWQILYDAGADVVLNGHDHDYERFAPQNPDGVADPARGIRQFVVGTGGKSLRAFETIQPNSEVRNSDTYGVLKLTLHSTSYDWEFVPITGQTFTDSGSASCSPISSVNQVLASDVGPDRTTTSPASILLGETEANDGPRAQTAARPPISPLLGRSYSPHCQPD